MKEPKGFQGSKFDKDKGVKQGSKQDMARDKKEIPKFMASKDGKKK